MRCVFFVETRCSTGKNVCVESVESVQAHNIAELKATVDLMASDFGEACRMGQTLDVEVVDQRFNKSPQKKRSECNARAHAGRALRAASRNGSQKSWNGGCLSFPLSSPMACNIISFPCRRMFVLLRGSLDVGGGGRDASRGMFTGEHVLASLTCPSELPSRLEREKGATRGS